MAFTVIPNLSPPSFTRLHLHHQSYSFHKSSSNSAIHHNHHHSSHLPLQSSVELPPVRVRVSPPRDPRQDFYVNLGLAFTGIHNYKLIFSALRFHGRILFKEISLEIFRVWQPSENLILIRWNLKGIPRVPWEAKGEFQGTSRYKLDRNGKIYEHKVDNLAFNLPQQLKPAISVLDLVSACPATPNPTFSWGIVDSTTYSSSWLDFYRAVKNTLDPSQDSSVTFGCQKSSYFDASNSADFRRPDFLLAATFDVLASKLLLQADGTPSAGFSQVTASVCLENDDLDATSFLLDETEAANVDLLETESTQSQ
ncbi:Protein of unknown function DUF2358 [Cynara cardunculus var. scolymus]|uniref:Uncharacterized protein n=1 Tax=Cynara cardunculus var. scolymus TaxID=59895 RepID=A0A103YJK0_CYNCS|nr:Protein of unknown function DUF2358 [Cynara cardunculus var. scolymus]